MNSSHKINPHSSMSRGIVPVALAALFVLVVSGCASTSRGVMAGTTQSVERVDAVNFKMNAAAWKPAPTCIWIKPFKAVEAHREPARLVREGIWTKVAARGYTLTPIDAAEPAGDCDYRLEGELIDARRDFMLFFSSNTVGAELRLIRQSTDELLWSASDAVDLKGGGLPLSFIGLSSGVFAATENMKPDRYLMAIDALSRRLVASLPFREQSAKASAAADWPDDLDAWLAEKPAMDREQALLELMSQPMSASQSEAAFARLVKQSPSPENWRNWVMARAQRAEPDRALALFDAAGDRLQRDPQSHYLKARLFVSMRRYEEAIQPLMTAIQQNPHETTFYEALAHIEIQRQRNDRAIAAFAKVVELDPAQAHAWLNIGILTQAAGDHATALEALKEASVLYLKRQDAEALDSLVEVLAEMAAQGQVDARDLMSQIAEGRRAEKGQAS